MGQEKPQSLSAMPGRQYCSNQQCLNAVLGSKTQRCNDQGVSGISQLGVARQLPVTFPPSAGATGEAENEHGAGKAWRKKAGNAALGRPPLPPLLATPRARGLPLWNLLVSDSSNHDEEAAERRAQQARPRPCACWAGRRRARGCATRAARQQGTRVNLPNPCYSQVKRVRCESSGVLVPKDKAIKRFIVRNMVDASAIRDLQEACVIDSELALRCGRMGVQCFGDGRGAVGASGALAAVGWGSRECPAGGPMQGTKSARAPCRPIRPPPPPLSDYALPKIYRCVVEFVQGWWHAWVYPGPPANAAMWPWTRLHPLTKRFRPCPPHGLQEGVLLRVRRYPLQDRARALQEEPQGQGAAEAPGLRPPH